jgi:anti-sigma B factor antagonist
MPVSFSIADSSDGPRKVVIWVSGELDADTARAVRARLAQAERYPRSDVVLDMTGVTFVDSVGVTAIIAGAKAMGDAGQLRVISAPERVAELFDDAGLAAVSQLLPNRRTTDRRKRDVAVEFERRMGGDRRLMATGGVPEPLAEKA